MPRLNEVPGGAVVFLGCGCAGWRSPALTFGRIWVSLTKACPAHQGREGEPLLLAMDTQVSPFVRTTPKRADT
jgi:hypothetical protein